MIVYCDEISVETGRGVSIRDVTKDLADLVRRSRVLLGTLQATVLGSTGSITTIEYEPGVVKDLERAVNALAPPGAEYEHEKAWHDGNGHSHVQAALLGPSLALPVRDGRLRLGTWQQAVVINHDVKARHRRIEVSVLGETG